MNPLRIMSKNVKGRGVLKEEKTPQRKWKEGSAKEGNRKKTKPQQNNNNKEKKQEEEV